MEKQKKAKSKVLPIILGAILIIGVVYGVKKYTYSIVHEDTDDAQLEGNISPVIPRISGYVTAINMEDNQKVEQGQVLVKLDDKDLQIRVDQAQAAVDNAIANVSVVRANVSSASAGIATAQANVESSKIKVWKSNQDYTRYEKLLIDKSITQQQYDNVRADKETAESQVEVSKKQLEAAQKQYEASQQQVAVAEAGVKQRRADLDFAKLQLSYATIIAPSTGIVSKKNVQIGQLVSPGQALFSIVNDSDVWVIANFKETQLNKIKVGQDVEVEIDAFSDVPLKGKVASLSAATGARFSLLPPDNATGNFVKVVQRVPVKIKVETTKEQLANIRPGMSVRVAILTK
jgi:membrane fusion protein (multidrug efflux system)